MAPNEDFGVLRFELPNSSPTGPVRHKWGVWREILSGRSASERALLLREATLGFGDSEFQASTSVECAAGRAGPDAAREAGAAPGR